MRIIQENPEIKERIAPVMHQMLVPKNFPTTDPIVVMKAVVGLEDSLVLAVDRWELPEQKPERTEEEALIEKIEMVRTCLTPGFGLTYEVRLLGRVGNQVEIVATDGPWDNIFEAHKWCHDQHGLLVEDLMEDMDSSVEFTEHATEKTMIVGHRIAVIEETGDAVVEFTTE